MDQITHEIRRQHWLSIVNACQTRTEDITVKQALMEFYDITASDTSSIKIHGLNEWIDKYRESDCPPLRRSVHGIETHKHGIINAWKYLKSNAHTESLNRDIKNVKRLIYINQCPLRRR